VETKMPEIGKKAPDFILPDAEGNRVKLSQFRGEAPVILYFYPKDNTPGCTKQACSFADAHKKILRNGAVVLGISPDSEQSHQKFIDKFSLPFTLLADLKQSVCNKYGVWVEKNMYGRRYMGVQRATFLIDKSGKVAAVWPKVKVDGHVDEVLLALKEL